VSDWDNFFFWLRHIHITTREYVHWLWIRLRKWRKNIPLMGYLIVTVTASMENIVVQLSLSFFSNYVCIKVGNLKFRDQLENQLRKLPDKWFYLIDILLSALSKTPSPFYRICVHFLTCTTLSSNFGWWPPKPYIVQLSYQRVKLRTGESESNYLTGGHQNLIWYY